MVEVLVVELVEPGIVAGKWMEVAACDWLEGCQSSEDLFGLCSNEFGNWPNACGATSLYVSNICEDVRDVMVYLLCDAAPYCLE
eukprot:5738443-Ditylum_brightwellii.AAC.1